METFAPKGKICGPILPQFILEKPITLGAKVMYALLCNYASEKDHCWPSHATLAARLSCSVSSVKNYLTELVRENLIAIRRERYRSSVYYLLCPQAILSTQKVKMSCNQPEVTHDGAKSGYINTLNKKNKEKNSPLPPVATKQPQSSSYSTPASGGVSSPVQDFESIWNIYPKKEAKGFARSAWLQLLRSGQLPPLAELHAAIQRFAASESWQREQGRFVPQMGNWLRGQRWLDSSPTTKQVEERHEVALHLKIQARKEQELHIQEQQNERKERVRPLFEAFAAKFPPLGNGAMAFGLWLHLHSQSIAPSASNVPPENTLGIVEFMNEFRRKAQNDAYRKTCETAQTFRSETGVYGCRPLGERLKTLSPLFLSDWKRSLQVAESPVTACA